MRVKKSFKNLIFNILQQVIAIITGFILPPLIIGTFGSTINGLISTIKQFIQYAQTAGSGIASASTYAMYKPLAQKKYKTLSGIFTATKKMFIKAGNVVSLIILLIALIYPCFINNVDILTVVCLVIIIGACGASEFYLIGKYQALFSADQKNFIVAIAQTLGNILNIIVTIILIKLNFNIIFVQLGATVVYLTRIIILTIYFKVNYKFIDVKAEPLKEKITQKNDAIIHEITALIVNTSSVLLISLILGLKWASVYSIYLLVFSGLNTICSIFSNGIYASFGDVVAKGEKEVLDKSYNIFECGFLLMIFIIYSVTFLMIMPFISVYTANIVDMNYYLPLLGVMFVAVGIINNIKIPARMLVIASGHFKQTKKYSFIEMIINVVGQLIFIPIFGIYGALIGCFLSALYRMINFIWYTNKEILNINNKRIIKRLCFDFLAGILIIVGISYLVPMNIIDYKSWILYAIIITVFSSSVYFLVSLITDKDTLKEGVQLLKTILKR